MAKHQTRAVPWTNIRPNGDLERGAAVRDFTKAIWVPPHRLRAVADRLHDIADDLEQENNG